MYKILRIYLIKVCLIINLMRFDLYKVLWDKVSSVPIDLSHLQTWLFFITTQ